jgi:hypothetical protein
MIQPAVDLIPPGQSGVILVGHVIDQLRLIPESSCQPSMQNWP